MTDRSHALTEFLAQTPWHDAQRSLLAGDASNRRYERLKKPDGQGAVLMDAPPEKGEDIRPFTQIARHLSGLGLSAPQIWHEDAANGFLILEDLGDDLYARKVADDPNSETPLYAAAIDVLVKLHQSPPPADLAPYSPKLMSEMAAHAWRWYRRGADMEFVQSAKDFEQNFEPILAQNAPDADVLIQRDYHAENLLWLPDREGVAKVGLLDFQDALAGHRAYDLVSLLQDARRDVSEETEAAMIARYLSETGLDAEQFNAAYHVLGAQRNLRIIGVFARLSMYFGKTHYVDLIPRVWGLLLRDLQHPALAAVKDQILNDLPEPTPNVLQKLRDKCATVQTL